MVNMSESIDLTVQQRALFNTLISHYKSKKVFSAQLVFLKETDYEPYLLKHGSVYTDLVPSDFILKLSQYSSSMLAHDGAVFIYPDGKVVFGGIIDSLLFMSVIPKKIGEYGAARALLRLITLDPANNVHCGLKCGKNLTLFHKGEKRIIYKSSISNSNHIHNYGIGLIISNSLPINENLRIVKMGCFKKISTPVISDVASCIADICHNPKHHDGFWIFSPDRMVMSGPYLVLAKVTLVHARDSEGLKRLTASLISHYLDTPVLLLRENSTKFVTYGIDAFTKTLDLQKHFEIFAGYQTSSALVM